MTIKDIIRTLGIGKVDVDKISELADYLAQFIPIEKTRSIEKARAYSDGIIKRLPVVGLALARVVPTLTADELDLIASLEVYHVAKWARAIDLYSNTRPLPSQSAEYAWHHLIEDNVL